MNLVFFEHIIIINSQFMFIRVFNFNVKIITMVFLSICYFQLNSIAQLNWSASIDSVSVLSSPRSVDLNNDGIKDVVIGSGTDSAYSNYGVVAINGANGQVFGLHQLVMKFSVHNF